MPSNPAQAAPAIPLFEPEIAGNEWRYVKECLDTGWVSSVGPYVDRFEAAMAAQAGCRHAVATTSGTAALHVALLVAGVQPDDEVIVSGLTFVAPANAIKYVGAHPVFIDAEPEYWQMDVDLLERFVTTGCRVTGGQLRNVTTGRRVRAIVAVHVLGHPCDMDRITALARRHELAVIEDASESLGATYRGRPVGQLGDIACFSFNGSKIVTSGGGGMITTNHASWAGRAKHLTTQAKSDPIEYVHDDIGYNYRLTNVQAAIGLAQLERLPEFVARKRAIAAKYAAAALPGVRVQPEAPWAEATWWLCTVLINKDATGTDSRAVLARLAAAGVQARPLWHPVPGLAMYRDCQVLGGEVMERLYREALSLPSSTALQPAHQDRVIAALRDAVTANAANSR
ncbi:MAG: LegC family aminotransferase [Acidobacteriia bacterium]|nr:LegC family aminotransferase [Terriglobia bacterium]